MKKSEIKIDIELDENHVPENLFWTAKDGGVENAVSKAVLLSIWDEKAKEALRIDLWTKDMPIDEMKMFYHQIFAGMANSYARATSEDGVAQKIREFAEDFALAAGIRE